MLGFILQKTPLKATSTFMGSEEERAAPHTKIGRVIYVTGERRVCCLGSADVPAYPRSEPYRVSTPGPGWAWSVCQPPP